MHRLVFLLLLICLPLHSLALQLAGVQTQASAGAATETGMAADLHHHDDDGSVHYDDSAESIAHADEHSAGTQCFLLHPSAMVFSLSLSSGIDYPDPVSYIPTPWQEDPQRPPAIAPGLATGG